MKKNPYIYYSALNFKNCIILHHPNNAPNFVLSFCERPRQKRPSKKRFGYLLGYLSFWVSGMEFSTYFFYTKNKKN